MTEPADDQGTYLARARRDAVRGSLWTFVATTAALPLGLVASVIVARVLGPRGLGRFATYTAIYAVVVVATNLGWSEATVQWLSSATARDEEGERRELIRRCAGFHVFISGPVLAGCTAVLLWGSGVSLAVLAAVVVWITQMVGTSTVINTASARNARAAQIALVSGTAVDLGVMAAAIASHRSAITWVAGLAATLIGPALAAVTLPAHERKALFLPKIVLRAPKGFWVYAVSACVGGLVASFVFGRSEVLVLRANGLLAAAGVFTVITGLSGQMNGSLDSLVAPLTPIAAGLVAIDRERAIRVFTRALRITAILGGFAACALVPAGVVAIDVLYGHAFAGARAPFILLGIATCTSTVIAPFVAFAFATRSAAQVLRINIVCLIADAAIAISLVPLIGLWGAVVANAAAQVLSLVFTTGLVIRRLGLTLDNVAGPLRLFGVGIAVGTAEAVGCLPLHGVDQLAVLPIIAVGLAVLRAALAASPQTRLGVDELALLSPGEPPKRIRFVLQALAYARVTK